VLLFLPGVNFTNVLRAAFTRADPKSAKKLLNLTVFFALLGSACVKAACRTLMKFHHHFISSFGANRFTLNSLAYGEYSKKVGRNF